MLRSAVENLDLRSKPPSADSREGRLDSWKEIATHLGRSVRTVQRWEREEGLPVHRLGHEKRGSVYALREELAAWWESRQSSLKASATPEASAAPAAPLLERVTRTSAATFWPALSSDGRMVAYVSDGGQDGTTPQIWLQQVGGAAIRLTTGLRGCADPSFGAVDTRIIFTAQGEAGQNVYEIPTLGGEPRLLRRAATGARISPDGKWLAYVSLESPRVLRIDALDEPGVHRVAPALIDVAFVVWSPDSTHVLVQAHPDHTFEPEYWVVPLDGGALINSGIAQRFRERGIFFIGSPPAWVRDALILSVITRDGVHVWRQRIAPETFQASGESEPLTRGTDMDHFPAAAAGRLVFVSTHMDQNLWSVPVDASSGIARGAARRMTRGPGIILHLTVTSDGRTLAYFMARQVMGEVCLRDLASGSESAFTGEPQSDGKGYPALSPSGRQLAFAMRMPGGPRAMRPIFVADLPDGASRLLCDDCGGRARQWLDERLLLVETFGARLNTFFVLDTTTGARRPLIASADRSVTNPRVSPDGRWIAFDATRPGGSPSVVVAPLDTSASVAESSWITVDQSASHPFWSAHGHLLYYLPVFPSAELRSGVRARRFNGESGAPDGDSFDAFASNEMVVPTMINGTAPVATADQIILVLGDFRGDVWMMDLDRPSA